MTFAHRDPKWKWRDYLTDDEAEILAAADKAKAEWMKLNQQRAGIQNRAIQRAKYAARFTAEETTQGV